MVVCDNMVNYFLVGFIVVYCIGVNADEKHLLCLYSEAKDGGHSCLGTSDPENLGGNPDIVRIIKVMGLPKDQIKFVGCENGRFSTEDISPLSSAHDYRISYPVVKDNPKENSGGHSLYIAPITHELSHVLQIELNGSIEGLKASRKVVNIELAADFISGIVFNRTEKKRDINDYQQNLSLVGMYKEESESAHGTWAQRTIAFRRGVFLKPDPEPIEIRSADSFFQTSIYGELLDVEKTKNQEKSIDYDPKLNKISACGETETLYEKLKETGTDPVGKCRSPHGALERTIKSIIPKRFNSNICFLSEPPSSILDGFSCFQLVGESAVPNLTCVRPSDNSVIVDHYNDKHVSEGAVYMAKASTCGVEVDSSVAVLTLFPPVLNFISRFEFGYVRSLGGGIPAAGQMQHGYASLDPSLELNDEKAIEYVSMFSGGITEPPGNDRRIGDWVVNVDDALLLSSEVNKMSKGNALFDSIELSFRRSIASSPVTQNKKELMRLWNKQVVDYLKEEGFKTIPEEELKLASGKDIRSVIKEMELNKPYGLRDSSLFKLDFNYRVMFNKELPECAWGGGGGIVGVIIAREPNATQKTDYGSIFFLVAGIGTCSQSTDSSRKYIEALVLEITESVIELVGEE